MTDTNISTYIHQENLKNSRFWKEFAGWLLALMIVLVGLVCFLCSELSKKRETVRYVEFSERGSFGFRVLPDSNLNFQQRKLLIEQQLKQYVINRVSNTASRKLNLGELDGQKVKYVDSFNSRNVADEFKSEMMRIYEQSEFSRRDVYILSYSETEDRKYRFDFETVDTYPSGEPQRNRWVVYLKYDIVNPNEITIGAHKEINPLGVKITYYRGDIDQQQKLNIENVKQQ